MADQLEAELTKSNRCMANDCSIVVRQVLLTSFKEKSAELSHMMRCGFSARTYSMRISSSISGIAKATKGVFDEAMIHEPIGVVCVVRELYRGCCGSRVSPIRVRRRCKVRWH